MDIPLIDALKIVKDKHQKALPHPALWESVCDAYEEPFEYIRVLKC